MTPGHNQLRAFVERIENREGEKKEASDDIAAIYAEAKSAGFDTKALRKLIRERREDASKRAEFEAILDTYRHALGMLNDTPLGQAAIERASR